MVNMVCFSSFADKAREFLVDYSRTVQPCHRVFC